jgi:hypothetical protein
LTVIGSNMSDEFGALTHFTRRHLLTTGRTFTFFPEPKSFGEALSTSELRLFGAVELNPNFKDDNPKAGDVMAGT